MSSEMREAYEAWFKEKFGLPPMPIHSRVIDFCWEGYQAGVESLRQQLAEREKYVTLLRDAILQNRAAKSGWEVLESDARFKKALAATEPKQ